MRMGGLECFWCRGGSGNHHCLNQNLRNFRIDKIFFLILKMLLLEFPVVSVVELSPTTNEIQKGESLVDY
jgi:hypothetical protein